MKHHGKKLPKAKRKSIYLEMLTLLINKHHYCYSLSGFQLLNIDARHYITRNEMETENDHYGTESSVLPLSVYCCMKHMGGVVSLLTTPSNE